MNLLTHQKVTNASYLAVAIVLITMPEMVFGLLTELVHFVFEFSTVLIEYIEIFLDHLIENLFHTNPHQTQVATFYTLTATGMTIFYFVWRFLFYTFYKIKHNIIAAYLDKKLYAALYWQNQSPLHKAKLVLMGTTGLAVLMLFGG